jgi:fumarate reductase subunit C
MRAGAVAQHRQTLDREQEDPRRPYRAPPSRYWWLEHRAYFLFVVRELTSVFVAAYCVFLLFAVHRIGQGADAYARLLDLLASPFSVVVHLVVLLFVLFHSITWFNLTPKIMVMHIGEEQVPPRLIAALVYAGWIAVSALVLLVLLFA